MDKKDRNESQRKYKRSAQVRVLEAGVERKVSRKIYKECRLLQSSTHLLIPKLSFQRLVREIMQQIRNDIRIQSNALEALQEAAEMKIVEMFEDSLTITFNARRKTVMDRDVHTLMKVTKQFEYLAPY